MLKDFFLDRRIETEINTCETFSLILYNQKIKQTEQPQCNIHFTCLLTWGSCVFTTADTPTRAHLTSRGSVAIWHYIKAGERDALQVLNWISCWISGTSLKCMRASPNDALIFALQRHSAYVCVVVMFVCVFPSISTSRLVEHNRYVCLISGKLLC